MSETTTTTAEVTETETSTTEPEPKPSETVDFWKQKAREQEKRAKANADAADRLAKLEEAQKTNEQRISERAETAEARATTLEVENTRLRVALEKGLPVHLVDRLRGDTPEEIAADADELLKLVTPASTTSPGPRPDLSQGAKGALPLNGDPLERDLRSKLGIA